MYSVEIIISRKRKIQIKTLFVSLLVKIIQTIVISLVDIQNLKY